MTSPTPWSLGEDAAGSRWITAADGSRVASVSAMADGDAELIVASVNAVPAAQAVVEINESLRKCAASDDDPLFDQLDREYGEALAALRAALAQPVPAAPLADAYAAGEP